MGAKIGPEVVQEDQGITPKAYWATQNLNMWARLAALGLIVYFVIYLVSKF